MHTIRRYLDIITEAVFAPEQAIGTILQVMPEGRFGSAQFVMRMANGDWHEVTDQGLNKGVRIFTLGDSTADPAMLEAAATAKRIGLVVEGIAPGLRLATGIQTLALPIGAVIGNPALPERQYVRQAEGMVDATGKVLPEWAFNADNSVWLE